MVSVTQPGADANCGAWRTGVCGACRTGVCARCPPFRFWLVWEGWLVCFRFWCEVHPHFALLLEGWAWRGIFQPHSSQKTACMGHPAWHLGSTDSFGMSVSGGEEGWAVLCTALVPHFLLERREEKVWGTRSEFDPTQERLEWATQGATGSGSTASRPCGAGCGCFCGCRTCGRRGTRGWRCACGGPAAFD